MYLKYKKKKSPKPNFVQPNKTVEERLLDKLQLNLPSGPNLSQQLELFSKQCGLSEVDYKERRGLCAAINHYLRFYFPKCEILMYGSTVNGLGFKGCDLDLLFLSHPEYSNTSDDPEEKVPLQVKVRDVKLGKIPKPMLIKMDETSLLQFIKQTLHSMREISKVIYIPAKHPILNFVARESAITCDLSASNRLVFYNSTLLNFFLKLDYRVKPLAMCLRFWAKKLHFIKKGEFTSYAFTLMIMFFLQNTQPPILPSVKQLSEMAGYTRKIDGWECSFTEDLNGVCSQNTEPLDVLLWKFFAFYWELNLTRNVISTYIGSIITVKDLLNSDDERLKQFKVSHICVQDPFILSKNVASNLTHGAIQSFKKATAEALNMLQKKKSKLKLTNFLNMKIFEHSKDLSNVNCAIEIYPSFDDFEFIENEHLWYLEVTWAIYKILDFVLLFECEVIEMSYSLSDSSFREKFVLNGFNMNATKDVHMLLTHSQMSFKPISVELELLLSIQCTTYLRTWCNRKTVGETIQITTNEESNPVLRHERSISDVILANNPLLVCSEPMFWFRCDIYKYNQKELSDIVVKMVPLKPCKELSTVFTFLKSFLPKTVIKYVRSMKQSSN